MKTPFFLRSKLFQKMSFSQETKPAMELILKKDSSLFSTFFLHNNYLENDHVDLIPKSLNLPTPAALENGLFEPQVLGSCNGVLCLSHPSGSLLWNPSTRTHQVFPNEPYVENKTKIDGLGYDKEMDNYKLVRFLDYGDEIYGTEIFVRSLNFTYWLKVSNLNMFVPSGGFTDVFVNGCLHFKMLTEIDRMEQIVAFDVATDEDSLIPNKPDCVDTNSTFEIGVLDGFLCMLLKRNREVATFEVLEMKEYGSEDSWVELFRFEMNDGPRWMRPITYTVGKQNKKKLLLQGAEGLLCIDVESHQQVPITGVDCTGVTDACLWTKSERILDHADNTA